MGDADLQALARQAHDGPEAQAAYLREVFRRFGADEALRQIVREELGQPEFLRIPSVFCGVPARTPEYGEAFLWWNATNNVLCVMDHTRMVRALVPDQELDL